MADLIQVRRATAAVAASNNVTLAAGELGLETDTGKMKVGDGSTAWNSLSYLNEGAVISTTGTEIAFAASTIYNTPAAPATGNITDNLTGAKAGIVQKIYHNHSVAPTVPAGWVLLGAAYETDVLNIIYAEWVSGSRVEYWIIQEAV